MRILKPQLFLLAAIFIASSILAQPTISSFSPSSGPVGTSVTITGTNFSTTPANNIVFFGAVKANVTAATATSLTVTVPYGATYQPITVTVNGLTGYSPRPFIITFTGGGQINSTSFGARQEFVTDAHPNAITLSDFDGDAKSDIATPNNHNLAGFSSVSVLRNSSSSGNITFAPKQDYITGANTYAIASGDIDGDGKPDLVSTNAVDATISIFRNTSSLGNISFAPKIDITANAPFGVVIGDIDGDGKSDIVTLNSTLQTISVFRNIGSPGSISFAAKIDFSTLFSPEGITLGDFDGDGKMDIAFTNRLSNSFSIYRNTSTSGNVSLASRIDYPCGSGNEPYGISVGDLDNDSKLDLAVVFNNTTGGGIQLFRNLSSSGTISFAINNSILTGGSSNTCYFAGINDINGDGKLDIALSVSSSIPGEDVKVYQNNSTTGTFSFGSANNFFSLAPYGIMLGDLQGDGRPELVTSEFISEEVSVFKNKCGLTAIVSFSPQSAASGATVTITGNNFTGATAVSFGGVPASSFTVVNTTTITAVVASGASGNVVVTAPLGTDLLGGFTFISTPTVTSFTPTSAASGTTVTITGTNFTGVTAVSFGFTPAASFMVVNSTTITAVVGAGSSGAIRLTNSSGIGFLGGFTYLPPPAITSFTPIVAGTGMTVQINGSNFSGATSVTFGGVPASSFIVASSSVISAIVGSGASGTVAVTTPNGTGSMAGFFYAPPPIITSFNPTSAPTNTTVTITGSNFSGVTAVSFGGVPASSFSFENATTINAVVANGASGDVSVTTFYGTSILSGFTYQPPPSITSFSPTSGPPGTTVTITGTDLSEIYAVSFQGIPAISFTIVNSTTITAVTGNGNTGPIIVSGTNGFFTSASNFTFSYSPPTITSFTPTIGTTGTSVTITGTNFIGVTGVSFGGISTFNFTVNSPTSITAVVANGSSGNVVVTTVGGTATLAGFTFTQPLPTITTFFPIDATTGTAITITGTNFDGTTAVSFGGVPASSFNVNSNTEITAIVGNGASGGISVTNPSGTGNSAPIFTFFMPLITSFTPTIGATGTTVTINGSGFFNISSVKFGGVAASSYTVVSQNQINAVVGTGASGEVSVTTNIVTATSPGFTFSSPVTIIGSVSPSIASNGMTINITGYGFTGATSVVIGGTPATSFIVNSNTSITAVVGAGVSGNITVTSPSGAGTFNGFIYSTSPVIASVNPETATIGSSIAIKGANFSTVAANNIVYFGPVRATILSATDTLLVVYVPIGATHDRISITTNARIGYSPKFFRPTFAGIGSLTAGSFANKIDSAVATSPAHISTSDLNIDGKPDIIVSSWDGASGLINIYKNSGSPGTISFDPRTTLADNAGPIYTISGDLDGDGKLDLVTGNIAHIYGLSIFRNTSTGAGITFGNQMLLDVFALGGFRPAIGDLDGDGKPELAVASENTHAVHVLKNTSSLGAISFAPLLTFAAPQFPQDISIGDIDMDGKPDIIVGGGANSGALRVLRNTSTASTISFSQSIDFITGNLTRKLIVGDIDGDGKPDVALVNETPRTMSIFRNTSIPGTISFANKIEIITGGGPSSIAFADVDGNSKFDILVSNNYMSTVSVFSNTSTAGSISFSPMVNFGVGSGPSSVTFGDFDMDGKPDIASSNKNASTISILRNLFNSVFINSFTPQSGTTGTTITITGTNLTGATAVSFGGVAASSFTIVNATTITAVVSNGASGSVSVTTPSGNATSPGFTYTQPAPTITLFTPTSGNTGTSITITGANFTGTTAISFGGVLAQSFVVNSPTSITAIVGAGASGNVSVITPGGTATATGFTYNAVTGIGGPGSINSNELIVNPNPAKDFLIIKHPATNKNAELSFYDMLGRKVKTILPARNSRQTDVILNYMTPGIYTIVWSDGTRVLSRIIVIN